MKIRIKQPLLKLLFVFLFLFLLFYSLRTQRFTSQLRTQEIPETQQKQGLPLRIIVPAIGVNASVQHVGLTFEGKMDVPSNITDVAWFELGSYPGEKGSAVIAGHINGESGEDGVFSNLYKLKKGDRIYIEDDRGVSTTFEVQESRMYDPRYSDEVFTRSDKAYLNLITCDGVWVENTKNYTKRLVVFSEISD